MGNQAEATATAMGAAAVCGGGVSAVSAVVGAARAAAAAGTGLGVEGERRGGHSAQTPRGGARTATEVQGYSMGKQSEAAGGMCSVHRHTVGDREEPPQQQQRPTLRYVMPPRSGPDVEKENGLVEKGAGTGVWAASGAAGAYTLNPKP
jgi:hypothetical protein